MRQGRTHARAKWHIGRQAKRNSAYGGMRRARALLTSAAATPTEPAARPDAVPGEIIVRYKGTSDAASRAAARERAGVSLKRNLLLSDTQLVRTNSAIPTATALAALNADPAARYAEPNALYKPQGDPERSTLRRSVESAQQRPIRRDGRRRHISARRLGCRDRQRKRKGRGP